MKRILCLGLPDLEAARDAALRGDGNSIDPLESIAEWCMRFSPQVALESSPSPESLFLDIGSISHLFGGEKALMETILGELVLRGFRFRAAVADTLGAAWAVAHFGEGTVGNALCGIPDAGNAPPRSGTPRSAFPTIIRPGETLLALRPLPIEALRLPEETVTVLHQLGIRRVEQLERIPRREVSSRLGPELLEHWDRAIGRLAEPLPSHDPPPRFMAKWTAEYATTRRETIEAALEHLAGQIVAMLIPSSLGALQLECRLECVSAGPVRISVGLFQPSAWATHLVQLLQVQFEGLRLPAPVQSIRLAATSTAPLELRQQELFPEESHRRNPRHLAGLIDRLSNRLGRNRVMRARLVPEAQPELACRYTPLVSMGGRHASARTSGRSGRFETPSRPLRLLARPRPLDGAITSQFRFEGESHSIAKTWGPERIETGWWRGRTVSRDYYRIETADGRRYWVFRRLVDGRWFLHGMFD